MFILHKKPEVQQLSLLSMFNNHITIADTIGTPVNDPIKGCKDAFIPSYS